MTAQGNVTPSQFPNNTSKAADAETGVGADDYSLHKVSNFADGDTGASAERAAVAQTAVSPTTGLPSYGAFPYGESPHAGGSLAGATQPAVTIVTPRNTVSTGGPTITVQWAFSQAEDRPQSSADVAVIDITTGQQVYTRHVTGKSQRVAFNAIAAGLNANSTGGQYQAVVTVYAGDPHLTATATATFDLAWGQPSIVITAPQDGSTLAAPSTQVVWSYADTQGKVQATERIDVHDSNGRLVATTGVRRSAAPTGLLYFFPIDQAPYALTVGVTNANGVPGSATINLIGSNPATAASPGAPALSDKTLRWYNRLPAYIRDADGAQPGQPLLSYMALIGEQAGAAEGLYDRFDWVPPNEGGPDPTSGLPHSRSDLVDPLSADDAWLPWLGNVLGIPQNDRSLPQWRVAMIPRPDPSGAFAYIPNPTDTVYGPEAGVGDTLVNEPLLLTPYAAGSKGGIRQAVQDLSAEAVQPAAVVAGTDVINAGYASAPSVARLLGAAWTSPDHSTLVISNAAGFTFEPHGTTGWVSADQTDASTIATFQPGESYTFQLRLTAPSAVTATLTATLVGTQVTTTRSTTATIGPNGTVVGVTMDAPDGVQEARLDLAFSGATPNEAIVADKIVTMAPVFTQAMVGAGVYGLGIGSGTTIANVLGPVSIELSKPAEYTVPFGLIVVVPHVPVIVTDHWLGNPNVVNVAVPFGTDPVALARTLETQQPAGVEFTITFGVLTWRTLYGTYGGGQPPTWAQIMGSDPQPRTWGDIERQLTT